MSNLAGTDTAVEDDRKLAATITGTEQDVADIPGQSLDELTNNKISTNTQEDGEEEVVSDIAAGLDALSTADATDASISSDRGLFGPFPPRLECPICFLALPIDSSDSRYMVCCGKKICNGCYWANIKSKLQVNLRRCRNKQPQLEEACAFCRALAHKTDDDRVQQLKKRMSLNDAHAFIMMAGYYKNGLYGLPIDEIKSFEFMLKAADEFGCIDAYNAVAYSYTHGIGAPRDYVKARKYLEISARMGNMPSHHNLGIYEYQDGNIDKAVKHWRLASAAGYSVSLEALKLYYREGFVSKDDLAETLRAYQASRDKEKSDERDRAAVIEKRVASNRESVQATQEWILNN